MALYLRGRTPQIQGLHMPIDGSLDVVEQEYVDDTMIFTATCFSFFQGQSDTPPSRVGGTLQSHARDVAHFIRSRLSRPPVLVGHSFGGLIVQQYLAHVAESPLLANLEGWKEPYPVLAGAVLACSVPPTGNGPLVQRYLRSKPIASIKVTLSFAAKVFAYNESLCRETFFSADMPSALVQVFR
ncbi:hypothetical protein L7F22_065115 [Adiantum nelumboides]|nr:hypothetical protein [Adiantum nelumboides]